MDNKTIEKQNQERQRVMEEMIKNAQSGDDQVYLNEVAMGPAKPIKVQK